MPANEGLYVLAPGGSEEDEAGWVSPRPIDEAIVEGVTTGTDLDADDLDDIGEYVDVDEVATLLDGDGDDSLSFSVEDHELVVDADGTIRVDE